MSQPPANSNDPQYGQNPNPDSSSGQASGSGVPSFGQSYGSDTPSYGQTPGPDSSSYGGSAPSYGSGPAQPYGSGPAQPYGAAPQQPYQGGPATAEDPGQTLGIVALIMAFIFAPVGIICGYLSRKKSREAGRADNALGKWGFILGIIFTILWVLYVIGVIIFFVVVASTAPTTTYSLISLLG